MFETNADLVSARDDAHNRFIALRIAQGRLDDAIRMMTGRPFAIIEGANLNTAEHWTTAHIRRAQLRIRARDHQGALADLQAAAAIPPNLPNPRALGFDSGGDARAPEIAYWTGVTYDAMHDAQQAAREWRKGAAAEAMKSRRPPQSNPARDAERSYYRALCMAKLQDAAPAKAIFESLIEAGAKPASPGRAGSAAALYIAALGQAGLGETENAVASLNEALRISPDLAGARTLLGVLR